MEFERDDEVEVVGNQTGLNQIGNRFTIAGQHATNFAYVTVQENNWMFLKTDLKLLPVPKDRLKVRVNKARLAWQSMQDKVDYLEETGAETLDAEVFKEHQLKKVIENGNLPVETKMERIKMLFNKI